MALNVKAAMLICMTFIGGLSWLLKQVTPPEVGVSAPLVVATASTDARPVASAARMDWPVPAAGYERRTTWARQLDRPNPLDAQADENRASAPSLAVLPQADPLPEELPPPALPPLLYEPVHASMANEVAGIVDTVTLEEEGGIEAVELAGMDEPPAEPDMRHYRVTRGDTLVGIAKREWGARDPRLVKLIVDANPKLRDRASRILVGEELLIPDPATAHKVLAGDDVVVALVGLDTPPPKTRGTVWYTIRENDSLTSIARRHLKDGRRWREILRLNRALDPDRIFPGTRIRIPRTEAGVVTG